MSTDTCAECDGPISDDPDVGEWPRSRRYGDLCVPCGVERMDPRGESDE